MRHIGLTLPVSILGTDDFGKDGKSPRL